MRMTPNSPSLRSIQTANASMTVLLRLAMPVTAIRRPRRLLPAAPPQEWLAWIDVRGTHFSRNTFGSDLRGTQVNALVGLTRKLTPKNFLVGVLVGYEHFDYSSQAFNGILKGDGWTTGAYLGWRFAPNLRFDAAAA